MAVARCWLEPADSRAMLKGHVHFFGGLRSGVYPVWQARDSHLFAAVPIETYLTGAWIIGGQKKTRPLARSASLVHISGRSLPEVAVHCLGDLFLRNGANDL